MAAPAPGLFSITTGWPMRFERPSAPARPMRSLAPPGENGTIHFTGRSGQSAWASVMAKAAQAAAKRARCLIGSSFGKVAIIAWKSLDAFHAAWQHSPINEVTEHPRDMKPYHFHESTLRTAAWPSCIAQEGMPRVGKDRPLSGTPTE